jgi:hypothetical protein
VGIAAATSTWDVEVEWSEPGKDGGRERSFLKVGRPVKRLALAICGSAGAVVGAIAGAASSRPDCRPLPRAFWVALAVVAGVLLTIIVLLLVVLRSINFNFITG